MPERIASYSRMAWQAMHWRGRGIGGRKLEPREPCCRTFVRTQKNVWHGRMPHVSRLIPHVFLRIEIFVVISFS